MKTIYATAVIILILITGCTYSEKSSGPASPPADPFSFTSQPYARYWWFASTIKKEDVRYNLDWLKENGFGGVELAWVYPLNRFNPEDTSYTPRQEWLSSEWSDIVAYTAGYADSIGLGCDMTLGTLWPFGDSYVPFEQATRRFGDENWRQVITRSWEHPKPGYVIDHLNPSNYLPYFQRLLDSFPHPLTKIPRSFFIDSWEVETEMLWTEGLEKEFLERYGYDIVPFMDSVYDQENSDHLYDYMSLVSEKVIGFYRDFDRVSGERGAFSRAQVSGAPCDLISGYAAVDIPESEAMLFEPRFSTIPASAALLSGKKHVSAETFTCLYGWPGDYLREEQVADLKLVADALFANGVNQIVWHGKPHNPAGLDTVSFYASVHVGPSGSLSKQLRSFNSYLSTVSEYMKKGQTLSDIAVYLPVEDAWKAGRMPVEKQFIWAWGHYEMRYTGFPEELASYNPVWINGEFLQKAEMSGNELVVGQARFKALYIDSKYLDYKVVKRVSELADKGLPVILRQIPEEPGFIKHDDYSLLVKQLSAEAIPDIRSVESWLSPFITGNTIPAHWCRTVGETLYVFFPNRNSSNLVFPVEYGQSLSNQSYSVPVKISHEGHTYEINLNFKPYQSLLYRLEGGRTEEIDIEFVPDTPVVKERPQDYRAPWLVYED
ncbi:MAG: glycosyl hydrolase [Bacteroidales bacterium]|nr:glycosyl hydrolase [Bacteroidales bacterium]